MKDRTPTVAEIRLFRAVLITLLRLFEPRLLVAIGRVAERAAREAGVTPIYVRHPARGGRNAFRNPIRKVPADARA